MLLLLSGRTHQVVTGVAVVWGSGSAEVAAEMTQVTMRTLSPRKSLSMSPGGSPWIRRALTPSRVTPVDGSRASRLLLQRSRPALIPGHRPARRSRTAHGKPTRFGKRSDSPLTKRPSSEGHRGMPKSARTLKGRLAGRGSERRAAAKTSSSKAPDGGTGFTVRVRTENGLLRDLPTPLPLRTS